MNDPKNAESTSEALFGKGYELDDAQFLKDAAEINLEEIQLGQLAQKNAVRDDVKELGKMMEEEHTKLFSELKELASKKAMTIPNAINEDGKDAYEKLDDKKESEF